ncbi:MAG: ABC-F family ATP-binding cassette domain-containing protein [Clostridia bacterium]|nr:ABC-F family ATP-binding cassette domain-containing protein [Clostridia bacterium]
MNLLTAINLGKSFGERDLFKNVSFNIDEKSKIGLIGANGVGKTTLFRVLCDEEGYSGSLNKNSLLKIGYMEQTPPEDNITDAYTYVLGVFSHLEALETKLEEIRVEIENDEGETEALINAQERLNNEYIDKGGLVYKSKCRSMLLGLGFSEKELTNKLSELSGGQRTRLSLARVLLSDANLLLLDEPTNHLDIESIVFLENFLKEYNRSFIVISHDRYFLDKVTNRTFELECEKLTQYDGNYTVFAQKKKAAYDAAVKKYDNTMKEINRIEGMIEQQRRWNREKNIKTAESKQKVIDRLEKDFEKPRTNTERVRFKFTTTLEGGNDVMMVTSLKKSYGDKKLFEDANLLIKKNECVFVLGPNGCGKTTFYRIIKGDEVADAGNVKFGSNIECSYFDQTRCDISSGKTVLDEVWDRFPKMTQTQVRNALAAFLFKDDDVFKETDCLSGGEKARIALLCLMLRGSNFILLDEPTNHLDLASREALEDAIADFGGTVFIISHDRYLINKLADKLFVFEDDTIREYRCSYDEYLALKDNVEKPVKEISQPKAEKINDYKMQKERERAKRMRASRISKLETLISETEEKINAVSEEINNCGFDYQKLMELNSTLDSLNENLFSYMEEWEQLCEEEEE